MFNEGFFFLLCICTTLLHCSADEFRGIGTKKKPNKINLTINVFDIFNIHDDHSFCLGVMAATIGLYSFLSN